jgi:succinyldiaminopimelate transaminase
LTARTGAPRLADFPWDALTPFGERARAHPDGIVDLSIGTPVDPTPGVAQQALIAAANAPGYPATHGTRALREAIAASLERRHGVSGLDVDAIVPTVGSKELVASLPAQLGAGPGDTVVIPELAYPTYEIGAQLARATPVRADATSALGPARPRLIWVNSPANPTGKVLPVAHLAKVVAWARERGTIVASDECYIDLGWDEQPVSLLHPDVCGGSHEGLLVAHSLSKRTNLAGYRAAFLAGDPALIKELLAIRRHAGLIVPWPVQAAMTAAYNDDAHVEEQRARYAARREQLRSAFTAAGFTVEHSQAGLYLWLTRGESCWQTVEALSQLGILVAPGDFYGPKGASHVRVAFTATDERVASACERLTSGALAPA